MAGKRGALPLVAAAALALGLCACSPLTYSRCGYLNQAEELYPACLNTVEADDDHGVRLGFVEYDDVGSFWDRRQMDFVLDDLEAELAKRPQIVVVFVHGWKHSAAQCDTNVVCFQRVLSFLSELEAAQGGGTPRGVYGVYVGWRGAAFGPRAGFVENASFWSRMGAARAVGESGGVTELFARIEAVLDEDEEGGRRGSRRSAPDTDLESQSRLIIVGHSLGAAIVYNSLAHLLTEGAIEYEVRREHLTPEEQSERRFRIPTFGNLVVLVNPAFEAARFENLYYLQDSIAQDGAGFPPTQRTVLAIFTSETDSATKVAFPAGRRLGSFWKRHRPGSPENGKPPDQEGEGQGRRAYKAVGHYEPFMTHRLSSNGTSPDPPEKADPEAPCGCPQLTPQLGQATLEKFAAQRTPVDPDQASRQLADLTLTRMDGVASFLPLKAIYVDSDVIENHNDIYRQEFIEALLVMILAELAGSS